MAETTAIAWTHSTFNGWVGCTKVGPGCDNCYAEAQDQRWHQGKHWGAGAPRRLTSESYWKKPFMWNERALRAGRRHLVFCSSQADVFDNEIDPQWRERLWYLIRSTPGLTWQLVTKRIGNATKMLPLDWGKGYPNVWLIATVVTQEECDRDIPKLLAIPAVLRGLSIEPQIERVSIAPWVVQLDWIICGGESRQHGRCRPFELTWAASLLLECRATNTAFFMKQIGSEPRLHGRPYSELREVHGKGDEPREWPAMLQVQEFPS